MDPKTESVYTHYHNTISNLQTGAHSSDTFTESVRAHPRGTYVKSLRCQQVVWKPAYCRSLSNYPSSSLMFRIHPKDHIPSIYLQMMSAITWALTEVSGQVAMGSAAPVTAISDSRRVACKDVGSSKLGARCTYACISICHIIIICYMYKQKETNIS